MKQRPSELLKELFSHEPTASQARFFEDMNGFLVENKWEHQAYILSGYAGTGKTSIVSALIKVLTKFNYRSVLLAPTGRAAKVISNYSGKSAQTIHKRIYKQTENAFTGNLQFKRQLNPSAMTVFIVDEASMISDEADFATKGLLTDLIEYVFTSEDGEEKGNKIIFIGDTAQLPPVGTTLSPALNKEYLESQFHIGVLWTELTEVMRQGANSGILHNATNLRGNLMHSLSLPLDQQKPENMHINFVSKGFKDLYRMTADRLEDGLNYAYSKFGRENTIIITRSNKEAVAYNRYIRQRIFYQEDEIATGDLLMIVRNNYFFLGEESAAGFLANGDFVELLKIKRTTDMYGFRFADVVLRLVDFPDEPEFEAKILLDTLYSDSPALPQAKNKELYEAVLQDYAEIVNKKERMEQMRSNEFLNALQVKFAYALTCHKSQGGQWPAVFLDQGYLTEENITPDWMRWLYTGMTRASQELYLMNFHARFFG
jgi:ATP-dependent exoDNAse (exonuclease V) alpha subunit